MNKFVGALLLSTVFLPMATYATEDGSLERIKSVYLHGGEIGGRIALNHEYTLSVGGALAVSKYEQKTSPGINFKVESQSEQLNFGLRKISVIDDSLRYFVEGVLSHAYSVNENHQKSRSRSLEVATYIGAEYFLVPRLSIESKLGLMGYYGYESTLGGANEKSAIAGTRLQALIVNWYF